MKAAASSKMEAMENTVTGRLRVSQIGSRGIPGHRGGVERVVEAVAPRLAALGHDVTVYCAATGPNDPREYRGVRLKHVRSPRSNHLDTLARSLFATLQEMFSSNQIVHYHASGSAPLAILPRLTGKKVIVTVHGLDWQRRKWSIFARWFLQLGEWAAMRLPHRTVVVGPDLKTALDDLYNSDVILIPNGVEDREQRPAQEILGHGLEPRKFMLFLARLVPEKQCHTLIEAWMGLTDKGGMKLAIAGPSWHSQEYSDSLKAMAKDDPSVVFLGEVSETMLEELYSNCTAYVLPSEVEGMSLSLLDAMAFGACVVTSDIPPNAYVVADAGLTFPVGNAAALRNCLQRIVSDPAEAERFRHAAKARISAEFRWDRVTEKWESLYRDILSGR
jgi:glycosyltransferase involved in cell wall biosynthesis